LTIITLCILGTAQTRVDAQEIPPQLSAQVAQIVEAGQNASEMDSEQLQQLVERTNQLSTKVEQSDEAHKKLLLIRLNKCRKLYQYMLELKQQA